ncbi:MAG TPA: alkaline phosphatase D family protein, partial [Polyangiaceae bacterium]|nr:alkaline phosphatase D family protein [Polyangiaceae bacterium]
MTLTRRRFLGGAAPLGLLPFLPACESHSTTLIGGAPPRGNTASPFLHGVASGDPLSDAVILWTRVTPPDAASASEAAGSPAAETGASDPVDVQWRLALDPEMSAIVASGSASTDAARDYTVKVDARGLQPGTTYYYDFGALGARSSVARTRTLQGGSVERVRFAVTCCANYPAGYFHSYRLIARRADLDVVIHLGDYIYEYGNATFGDGTAIDRVPSPDRETTTLADYRQRHAQYKLDPDLQEVHRQHPFIAIWDDHEVANNASRDGPVNHEANAVDWDTRKAAAMQAYFEWMPIREVVPGDTTRVYRQFAWGDLLDLIMIDTRYLRDRQLATDCDAGLADPDRSLLGSVQEQWLLGALQASQARGARWRVLGQQVMLAQRSLAPPGCVEFPDQWDGYPFSRQRLLAALAQGIDNVVVLTGDAHSSWAFDVAENPFDPASYVAETGQGSLAVEFVAPAITSSGPGGDPQAVLA